MLDEIYKLLHPFMPFMTEELWAHTAGRGHRRASLLCHAEWPTPAYADDAAADDINWLIDLVSGIRSVRAEMNVPPAAVAPLVVVGANSADARAPARHEAAIKRLARVDDISLAGRGAEGPAQIVIGEATACLPLGTLIDLARRRRAAARRRSPRPMVRSPAFTASSRTRSSSPTPIRKWSRPNAIGWKNCKARSLAAGCTVACIRGCVKSTLSSMKFQGARCRGEIGRLLLNVDGISGFGVRIYRYS